MLMRESKDQAIRSKYLATYWLGLLAYETGKFRVAADYFQKRILDVDDNNPWEQGARYNLARANESIGLRDGDPAYVHAAIELLRAPHSTPQRTGNLLRAERLSRLLANLSRVN
jgi:tetratricopeptide (TPR) repeat protein